MKTSIVTQLFIFIFFICTSVVVSAESPGPTAQLQPTLDKLIKLLADDSLKGDEHKSVRREEIMSTISVKFDFREMSKRILSKTWNSINSEEKDYFTKQMTKLLENNYIGQLENYSGQSIEYNRERIKGEKAQVSTIIMSKGKKYPVHYIMLRDNEKWMVYDINIEGVSLVRNYRAEFKSIVRKEKFEGLIKVLEEKNKSFE